jgi:OmpA-OmpF porin, OOP family
VKTIQRAIQIMACGLVAMAAAPSAMAEADAGFYIGLGAGQSSFDLNQNELDDLVFDVFFSQGLPVISGSSTFEDSDTATALFGGYRFNPYISVEAGYLNLGTAEYRSRGTVNPPGPIASLPVGLDMDFESKGFTIAGIGSLPVGSVFDLHARLGLFIAETDLTVAAQVGNGRDSDTESLDSQNVLYGAGAAFHIGDHWSVSLDWTQYANVGDEDEDDDSDTEGGIDIDTFSLGAMFRF